MPHNITIYTDGAASGNPGPGGYGVVLMAGAHRKELSEGFRRTTNNRMELLGVITALEALKELSAPTARVRRGGRELEVGARTVVPGDVLELSCELVEQHGPVGFGKATAKVDGKLAARCELTFVIQ